MVETKAYFLYYHIHVYYIYQGFNFNILCVSLMKSLLPFSKTSIKQILKEREHSKVCTLCIFFSARTTVSFENGLKTLKTVHVVDAKNESAPEANGSIHLHF